MAIWLLAVCATIFAMVVLGGVTRLTGSGLSIVEWDPIMGAIPPLTYDQWMEAFRLYQASPEFQYKNFHMSLDDFKGIFWFEYAHRLLGRAIGVIFFVPMVYFIVKGWVGKTLRLKFITIFILGGLQGALGWYMVKSGLVNDPHVSQYRLTAHLGMAFVIFAYSYWVALGLLLPAQQMIKNAASVRLSRLSYVITTIVFITVLSGGLVAGTRAGFVYNTFPLMDGSIVPNGLFMFDPLWRNFFENIITVQYDHRLLAITTFCLITAFWLMSRKAKLSVLQRTAAGLLMLAACMQVALGISTLVLEVPIALAAIHQGGAVVLFSAALFALHVFRTSK
ncbi:MAG: COX15/CtaA family protein [Gammaproteobacteria bacterium]|nr:COX15/CtaA family protein [Gammaproteobacteria bacterium]